MTEIAQSGRRGQLVALVDVAINLGIVLGYIVAYIIDTGDVGRSLGVAPWRVAMGVSVVPPLLFAVVSPWLPESPRWLVSKGRVTQANKAIHRLKASTASEASVADALEKLRRDQQRAAQAARRRTATTATTGSAHSGATAASTRPSSASPSGRRARRPPLLR